MLSEYYDKAKSIVSRLTLDEKVGQMHQCYYYGDNIEDIKKAIKEKKIGSIILASSQFAGNDAQANLNVDDINEIQKFAIEQNNTGIPMIFGRDVIHGHSITFPIPLAMAASFDPDSVEKAYSSIGIEAANEGVNWAFAPMLDFCHEPRWGRISECQGEDPYLASEMARAIVKGFQGDDLSKFGNIAACSKHYIGYGASEGGRDYNHTEISDYSMQNCYLPAFRSAVNAGAATVMSSFNEINGIPVSANRKMLTEVLREQLGFEGFVVSDWGAIEQMIKHGVAKDYADCASISVKAGIDMDMVDTCYLDNIKNSVENGIIAQSLIDSAVTRIIAVKLALGLFENPFVKPIKIDLKKHAEQAREMAVKSSVLLKNNGVLPLEKSGRIVVTGPFATLTDEHRGTWSLGKDLIESISILDAIKAAAPDSRVTYLNDLESQYPQIRKQSTIICVLGEPKAVCGEAKSLANIEVTRQQVELIKTLKRTGMKIVGVLCYGRPIVLSEIEPYLDAMLLPWHGGTFSSEAVASILFGDSEPLGRLPVTFPAAIGQIPIYYNAPKGAREIDGYYGEENTNTYNYVDCTGQPMYPFGYGLTYTDFEYSAISVNKNYISYSELKEGRKFKLSVTIENKGSLSGTETVQLYVRDVVASRVRPIRELKAFKKIKLSKGEKTNVEFEIGFNELGFFLEDGSYIVEKGDFKVFIGANSLTENEICVSVN